MIRLFILSFTFFPKVSSAVPHFDSVTQDTSSSGVSLVDLALPSHQAVTEQAATTISAELQNMLLELKTGSLIRIEKLFTGPLIDPQYYGDTLHTYFQCPALFKALLSDESTPLIWPPPTFPPDDLLNAYTLSNQLYYVSDYHVDAEVTELQNSAAVEAVYEWSEEYINGFGKDQPNTCGLYLQPQCAVAMDKYKHFITNKTGDIF